MDSSAQRNAQIQQMCDFIIQEAKEKVNEIHLQTAHDSNLEKQMTVHKAKSKIQKEVKDKEKQVRFQRKRAPWIFSFDHRNLANISTRQLTFAS